MFYAKTCSARSDSTGSTRVTRRAGRYDSSWTLSRQARHPGRSRRCSNSHRTVRIRTGAFLIDEIRRAPVGTLPFVPPPKGSDWQDRSPAFDGFASFEYAPFTFTDGSDAPLILGARVRADYFSVLQTKPYLGRNFTDEDGSQATTSVAIVTYGFWQGRLGGDPNVLGRTLKFSEVTVTIVGSASGS
jgi:hypothetical protein